MRVHNIPIPTHPHPPSNLFTTKSTKCTLIVLQVHPHPSLPPLSPLSLFPASLLPLSSNAHVPVLQESKLRTTYTIRILECLIVTAVLPVYLVSYQTAFTTTHVPASSPLLPPPSPSISIHPLKLNSSQDSLTASPPHSLSSPPSSLPAADPSSHHTVHHLYTRRRY